MFFIDAGHIGKGESLLAIRCGRKPHPREINKNAANKNVHDTIFVLYVLCTKRKPNDYFSVDLNFEKNEENYHAVRWWTLSRLATGRMLLRHSRTKHLLRARRRGEAHLISFTRTSACQGRYVKWARSKFRCCTLHRSCV